LDRESLFPAGEPARLPGLASLTAPAQDEAVAAVVDIAVVGARSDGKTQFILHAIRTLGADAPDNLPEAEHGPTLDIMQVVLAAESPRPDANNPDAGVPHYVFRLQPRKLLEQIGFAARLGLLARTMRLGRTLLYAPWLLVALVAAAACAGAIDPLLALAGAWLCGSIGLAAYWIGSARLLRRGPIEIVFWDVAGENLYGGRQKSADYWALLRQLCRRRRQDARPDRPYGFAPVLLCNPLALGEAAEDSPFGRLRTLLPIFAALGGGEPEALIVVNRWQAVRGLCPAQSDREQLVAVVTEARAALGKPSLAAVAETEPLPVVRRGTVRACCVDLEDTHSEGVRIQVLRYDAGLCELTSAPWNGYAALDPSVRARWREPAREPAELLWYRFNEGPRAFEAQARRGFLRWLGRLAFCSSTRAPATPLQPAPDPVALPAQTLQMFAADDSAAGFRGGGS
jgi:hypothetical protein